MLAQYHNPIRYKDVASGWILGSIDKSLYFSCDSNSINKLVIYIFITDKYKLQHYNITSDYVDLYNKIVLGTLKLKNLIIENDNIGTNSETEKESVEHNYKEKIKQRSQSLSNTFKLTNITLSPVEKNYGSLNLSLLLILLTPTYSSNIKNISYLYQIWKSFEYSSTCGIEIPLCNGKNEICFLFIPYLSAVRIRSLNKKIALNLIILKISTCTRDHRYIK